jgi:two-component system, OmpR family, response regulator
MSKILIIDDNFELTRLVNLYLSRKHDTSLVFNVQQAMQILRKRQFDLLMIDRVLPDGDGLEVLRFVRDKELLTPVLILSNKGQVEERVKGLREGADDYMSKPFSMDELLLKVEKMLGTTKRIYQNEIHVNKMILYENEGKVLIGKREVKLRPREFKILLFLARHQNQVISRNTLIEHLWNEEDSPTYSTIDVYIRRIRMLLGETQNQCLKTFRGYGYMIRTEK